MESNNLSIKSFSEYQGLKITNTSASKEIAKKQKEFIESGLSTGISLYLCYIDDTLERSNSLHNFFSSFHQLQQKAQYEQSYLDDPDNFYNDQQELFRLLHDSSANDSLKLFGEFFIGLVRFDIASQLQHIALTEIGLKLPTLDNEKSLSFFQRLNSLGTMQGRIKHALIDTYVSEGTELQFWEQIATWVESNPRYKPLLTHLVSMHFIPSEIQFVTLAQILHWNGWGGDGQYLFDIFGDYFPELLKHCIGYISDESEKRFSQIISNVVAPLLDSTTEAIFQYCDSVFPSHDETISILDLGSGPSSKMVAPSIDRLKREGYSIKFDALDICELDPTKGLDRTIYYVDANDSFADKLPKKYNIVCVGYVLHQLVDIQATLKQLLQLTVNGGIVLTLQIKPAVLLQFAVVPLNLVDRESFVPEFSLSDLSILPTANEPVKLLYPLTNLNEDIPRSAHEIMGGSVWGARNFICVELPVAEYNQLLSLWESSGHDVCDSYLADKGYSIITQMQATVTNMPRT
jgi:hypothetical protein